jgi:hypothetical protein
MPSRTILFGMGIRYYAYPVEPEMIDLARKDPRAFVGDDPLADAWGPLDERPPMLYLDKAWREFQLLLATPEHASPRPALSLVDGRVTHTGMGWIPHFAVLSPEQVSAVSADLATVSEPDIRTMIAGGQRVFPQDGIEGEISYVFRYLRDAQTFCAELSEKGLGLAYMIG